MRTACHGGGSSPLVARRVLPSAATTLATTRTEMFRQRDVRRHADKLEGREPLIELDRQASARSDSRPGPEQGSATRPVAPSSDVAPAEESTDDRPPDQRPMLVRILMSVFRSFWQSIGRVWEVLPGTKPLRIVFFLFILAVYNVRSFILAFVCRFLVMLP
jgi:hypothetical protein